MQWGSPQCSANQDPCYTHGATSGSITSFTSRTGGSARMVRRQSAAGWRGPASTAGTYCTPSRSATAARHRPRGDRAGRSVDPQHQEPSRQERVGLPAPDPDRRPRAGPLRNSRYEAERATRLLTEACGFPVHAKAALVFLTGTLIPDVTIKVAPEDVAILDRTDIPGAFRRTTRKLTDEQVAVIFELATPLRRLGGGSPQGPRSKRP